MSTVIMKLSHTGRMALTSSPRAKVAQELCGYCGCLVRHHLRETHPDGTVILCRACPRAHGDGVKYLAPCIIFPHTALFRMEDAFEGMEDILQTIQKELANGDD